MQTSPYYATQIPSFFAIEMERKTLSIFAFSGRWRKSLIKLCFTNLLC